MNHKKISIVSSIAMMALIALPAFPVSAASVGAAMTANAGLNSTTSIDTSAQAKADAQITARLAALNALSTRISQMQKISSTDQASLEATLQGAISDMTALKAKIDADTDNATLKADIQSITKSYRVYVLILPQGRITAAADRVMDISGLMTDLAGKLQTRITAAQNAGQNVAPLTAELSDMTAKYTDANNQAQAAVSEIINLQPDNGDKTVFASNQAALKDARSKIKVATADLKTARQDAGTIVKGLMSFKVSASGTATTTP